MYHSSSLETSEDSFTFDSGLCTAWRRAGDYYEVLSFFSAEQSRGEMATEGEERNEDTKVRGGCDVFMNVTMLIFLDTLSLTGGWEWSCCWEPLI